MTIGQLESDLSNENTVRCDVDIIIFRPIVHVSMDTVNRPLGDRKTHKTKLGADRIRNFKSDRIKNQPDPGPDQTGPDIRSAPKPNHRAQTPYRLITSVK
jgi:hypothetical protein